MERCDPQATGRSRYPGPRNGVIEWVIEDFEPASSLSIGKDSSVYCRSFNYKSAGFKAIQTNGEIKWSTSTGSSGGEEQTSIVLSNGNIITNAELKLFSISMNGDLVWTNQGPSVTSALALDKNSNIYALGYNSITIYNRDGEILLSNSNLIFGNEYWISFSPDGNTIYLPSRGNPVFYAYDIITQSIKWEFRHYGSFSYSPLVDSKGNLYIITANDLEHPDYNHAALYSLSPEGSIRWKYDLGKRIVHSEIGGYQGIAMDKFGNIYTGQDSLIKINYAGKSELIDAYESDFIIHSPITIDCEGYVYLIISDFKENKLLGYLPDGHLLFSIILSLHAPHIYSLVIGYDNSLYVASYEGSNLYKIK